MSDTPTDTTSTALVQLEERDDGIAVVTLSHGKVNALCVELLDQLHQIAEQLTRHAPRAVVVTGGPKVFAAGADITEFAERGGAEPFALSPPDRVREIGGAFLRALNAVAALPSPTIAAVAGVALGGGCELALACDFRIAGTNSRFGQPEIQLGIIPGGGGTQRLARLVGPARAKDLVFTGRMVGADEALQIGLVDRVVEPESVLTEALAQAAALAKGPRHALALAKAAIDEGLDVTLEEGLQIEQDRFVQSFTTPDAAVGVRSFLAEGPGKAVFD
jgi:enoyl-CoA hydratase/carnithine racemase